MNKYKTCEERIDEALRNRIEEIKEALDSSDDIIKWINSYALAYDDDPHYKAKRLELSFGGPSDGFRFFEDGTIEYYFNDWFDGTTRKLSGENENIMKHLYNICLSF